MKREGSSDGLVDGGEGGKLKSVATSFQLVATLLIGELVVGDDRTDGIPVATSWKLVATD